VADCLIDTNIASYLFRGDIRAELYRDYPAGKSIGVSFMTIAELRHWALARNWGAWRREQTEALLTRYTIFYADDELCRAWAIIVAERERNGRPIDTAEAWVAAPAWLLSIPPVTHNARHFANIAGLQINSFG
jgi:tRNA(fMet)-specific endonuclease VapC